MSQVKITFQVGSVRQEHVVDGDNMRVMLGDFVISANKNEEILIGGLFGPVAVTRVGDILQLRVAVDRY